MDNAGVRVSPRWPEHGADDFQLPIRTPGTATPRGPCWPPAAHARAECRQQVPRTRSPRKAEEIDTKSNLALRRVLGAITAGVLAGGVLALSPLVTSPVHAASIVVNTTQQGLGIPRTALQEAILAANQDATTVEFDPGPPHPREDVATGCAAGSGDDVIESCGACGIYAYNQPLSTRRATLGSGGAPDDRPRSDHRSRVPARSSIEASTAGGDFATLRPSDRTVTSTCERSTSRASRRTEAGDGADGGGGGMGAGGAIFVDDGGSLRVQWSTFEDNVATGGDGDDSQFSPGPAAAAGAGRQRRAWGIRLARWRWRWRRAGSASAALAHNGGGGGGTRLDGGFAGAVDPNAGANLRGRRKRIRRTRIRRWG